LPCQTNGHDLAFNTKIKRIKSLTVVPPNRFETRSLSIRCRDDGMLGDMDSPGLGIHGKSDSLPDHQRAAIVAEEDMARSSVTIVVVENVMRSVSEVVTILR
jgi:hypothetical protein